jgi:hypothetical protein
MAEDIFGPAAGLRPPRPPRPSATSSAAGMGVRALRTNIADAAIMQDPFARLSPVVEPRERIAQPAARSGVFYNPATDQFSVGGQEFGSRDYDLALQAASQRGQPAPAPIGAGWQRIADSDFDQYLSSISEGRGILGNLGAGARITGEAFVGGVGRGLQMLGAEEAGQALVGAGEAIGLSPAEEARSAAIYAQQTPLQRFGTGLVQAVPSLAASVIPGLGAAGLAVRAGATAGGAVARAASASGAATTVLPMHIYGSWEAAARNPNLDTSDPEIQTEILMTALTKTGIDLFGQDFAIRGLSSALRGIVADRARRSPRLRRALGAAVAEGTAELLTEVVDQIVFDEDARAGLSRGDWSVLWPVVTQKYREQNLMAFGIGAVLGGGLGALSSGPVAPGETPPGQTPSPNRDLTGTGETDVLNPQAAPIAPTPEQIAAGQAQLDALGIPAVQPGVAPTMEAGLRPPAPPILDALGPRTGALSAEEQNLADRWAARAQPPLPLTPDMRVGAPPLALPAPTRGGTVIPPAPLQLTPAPLQLTPEMREQGPIEQAAPIVQQRTDLPPGAARLRQRPSERVETYAPAPVPAADTAMGAQLNQLLQQARVRQEAEQAAQAEAAARAAQEGAQRTQREDQLLRSRREQVQLEQDTNILGEELVGSDFNILGADARAEWDAAVAALDPAVRAEVLTGEPTTLAGNQAQADLARLGAAIRNRRSNVLRRQRAQPPTIITPLPPNTYGTEDGQPFKTKRQANAPANRKRVAEQITEETDQRVTPKDLEAIEVPGGWALRVKETPPPPATPPTGGRNTQSLRRGASRAVQEPSPAPRAPRQGPQARQRVREEDTQGQEAAGEGQAQAEAQAEVAPTIARGDNAPSDMGVAEAWDTYVKPFLMVPVDRTIISQAEAAQAWSTAVKAGRGNVDTALNLLRDSVSYTALEAQMILQQDADVRVVDEDARDSAMYALLETAFVSDPTGSKPAALGKKTAIQFSQDTLAEHNWTQADRDVLLDFATQKDIADARKAAKPTRQMQALNALLESTGVLSVADNVDGSTVTNPASDLAEEISAYNENPHTPEGWEAARLRELVRNFNTYARENPEAYGSVVEGNTPIYQYLDNKGYVRFKAGRITPDPTAADPRTQSRITEGGSTEAGGALTGGFAPRTGDVKGGFQGRYSRVDYNSLTDAVDGDGKPLAGPMPVGKQKFTIRNFLGRLRNPPRVYDFKDQADLQRRAPELYARASAARVEGDFDSVAAAGYSFGDGEVIIFTDRIANEAHLKFVLAHETFGHYGLRGILPTAEFDSLMNGIYNGSTAIQRAVDAAMARNPDLGKAEAVEEYLSDYAAELDVSVVRRVWNAIKNALNRLGVTFADDSVRYVLDQARRYARGPRQGYAADLNQIGQRLSAVEMGTLAPGRFKPAADLFKDNRSRDELARMGLPLPRDFQQGLDAMQGKWGDFASSWAGFKSTFLSLHGFDARTNPGLNRLHNVLQEATSIAMAVRNTLNETMRPALDRAILGRGGMTDAQYGQANNLLHHARIRAVMRTRANPVDSDKPLVVFNEATGRFERTAEVDRLDKMNRLTIDEARRGFTYEFVNTDADGNVAGRETITVPPIPNLTEGSKVWLAYEAARKAYIDTEMRLLIAQLSAGTVRESTAFKEIGSVVPDGTLDTNERALMRRAIRRYQELYAEGSSVNSEGAIVYVDASMKNARDFAEAFNMAVIANEPATDPEAAKRNDAVKRFFDQAVQDDVVAEIEAFKVRAKAGPGFGNDRFLVQNKIISLHTQSMQENGASDFARNSITNQYAPIVREGDWETRLRAVDVATGRVVSLDAGFKDGLLYSQFGSRSEALNFQKQVRSAFGTDTYTVKARNNAGEMVDTEVRLEPVVNRVLVEAANPLGVNLNEFIAGLNYFNINLRPEKREEIIQAMTRQDAAARSRLRAGLNPGDARDAISGIAKHIDSRSSTIAKVQTRPLIDELMNRRLRVSNELWNGDGANLERLRKRLATVEADPRASKETRTVARREYEDALMMYNATNPADGESRANEALNKAARTLNFLDNNASVNESDFEGSGVISAWRSYTSLIQLGGSIATGLLNPVSVFTNGVPYLASYNEKTAFGGGFGAGRSMSAVLTAFSQVGIPGIKGEGVMEGMNTADFWDKVEASRDLQQRFSVTKREAQMIAREIREGRMIPAQSNALVNSSRGRTTRGALSKGIDLWMSPFNLTEQASRRAFGLAAFRLEYARQMGAIDPTLDKNSAEYIAAEQTAYDRAVEFAGKGMDTALGDYSVLNRPAFFRSGLASMLYMYKVFPTTSIQMFMNLSRNGKLGMLAGLWLLGGVAAFPFAEDLEDLFDTLLQKSGIGEGSVRAWAAQRLDEISPGLTPLVLKGVMGNVFVGDIASRVSLSVIPGTDILLAGANTTRSIEEIAGPMPSALLGTLTFAADLIKTPFSTTQTLEATLRAAPVTGLRMAADTYAYAQTGAIIDRRGYIVAPNVTTGEMITRLAGFYPRRAAEQYGNVRVMKRVADYRREATTAYRQEWVAARVRNDRARMREIEQAVRDWNRYHRGGPLVINDFVARSQRAYREALRPAGERTLRTLPTDSRDQLERVTDALTF